MLFIKVKRKNAANAHNFIAIAHKFYQNPQKTTKSINNTYDK